MEGIYLALLLFGMSFTFYALRILREFLKRSKGGDINGDGRNS